VKTIGFLVLAAVLMSACGTVSTADATKQWMDQSNFTNAHATLVGDATAALRALNSPTASAPERHTVCEVLYTDTSAAISALPTPDQQATNLLDSSYTHFGVGAHTCFIATTTALIQRATHDIYAGLGDLSFAKIRLGVVTGG